MRGARNRRTGRGAVAVELPTSLKAGLESLACSFFWTLRRTPGRAGRGWGIGQVAALLRGSRSLQAMLQLQGGSSVEQPGAALISSPRRRVENGPRMSPARAGWVDNSMDALENTFERRQSVRMSSHGPIKKPTSGNGRTSSAGPCLC